MRKFIDKIKKFFKSNNEEKYLIYAVLTMLAYRTSKSNTSLYYYGNLIDGLREHQAWAISFINDAVGEKVNDDTVDKVLEAIESHPRLMQYLLEYNMVNKLISRNGK